MEKDGLWDCCLFPAVMLGEHSPIQYSLSSIIRERWGEHRKHIHSHSHTLGPTALWTTIKTQVFNHSEAAAVQRRRKERQENPIPFLCWISPAEWKRGWSMHSVEHPHIMKRSTITTTAPLYHIAVIRKSKFFGTFWGNRWEKSDEILFFSPVVIDSEAKEAER